MAVLIASELRKEFAGDPLFENVSFTVGRKRPALARRGERRRARRRSCARSPARRRIQGGKLAFAKGTRIALHDQRPPLEFDITLREYALSGARDLLDVEDELRRLETAMTEGAHDEATLRRYAEAQARLEHAGGWAWRDRAAAAVRGLGFADDDLDRPLGTFSGGELTRASLARALAGSPDLLLLDEPTNHLDVENLEWLERELETIDAAVILVAHDRWFLEAVTTSVLELSPGGAHYFAGPWHEWRQEKAARAAAAEKTAGRVSVDIARLERFVERFRYKKSKAKQAQAKLTQIATAREGALRGTRRARVAHEGGAHSASTSSTRRVPAGSCSKPTTSSSQQATSGCSTERRSWSSAARRSASSGRTARANDAARGAARRPSADHGRSPRPRRRPGYFSQHALELPRPGRCSTRPRPRPGLPRPQAQTLLGRFLFSGWETHERAVTALSGGERRRLALALLVASGANFLVLDEPTNHLDVESREALEEALEAFPGTVLLVSHDRALLDAVPDRIVAFEDGALRSYDGGWADMERERSAARRVGEPEPDAEPVPRRSRLDQDRTKRADAPSSSAWRPRSPASRPGSPSSSGSWPTTGRTWTS